MVSRLLSFATIAALAVFAFLPSIGQAADTLKAACCAPGADCCSPGADCCD